MTDTMTPDQRHVCMSHIRSKDTKPELKVRKWLWSHGYRYRLNVKSVPGKPDIVMRPYRTAIFVNGCFWHGHGVTESPVQGSKFKVDGSKCCKIPQSNREFWVAKIRRNREHSSSGAAPGRAAGGRHLPQDDFVGSLFTATKEEDAKNLASSVYEILSFSAQGG